MPRIGGAGRESCRVEIQRKDLTPSGPYNEIGGFQTIRQPWIEMSSRMGRERFADGGTESSISHIGRGSYFDWLGITAADRVFFEGRTFQIIAVKLDFANKRDAMIDLLETSENPADLG